MRTATLYSTEQRKVTVYGGSLPYHVRKPIRVWNSEEILDATDVIDVHHLPVERWVFDGEEYLIALDPTLRDIVNSMIGTSEEAVRRIAQTKINKLNYEIKQLQSRTIWNIICSKLKRKNK